MDTLTGAVLRTMRFPSTVNSVAVSPDGRLVYVTFEGADRITRPPMFGVVVEEIEASSLRVLARRYIDGEMTADATAVPGGVWVSNTGGMQWSEFLYHSPNLSQVGKPLPTFPPAVVPELNNVVTQGDSAQIFGRSVFLVGSGGASCDDPGTGSFIAGAPFPELSGGGFEPWDPFAAWHGLLYGARLCLLLFEPRCPGDTRAEGLRGLIVKAFAYLTAVVLVAIGIGVGLLSGLPNGARLRTSTTTTRPRTSLATPKQIDAFVARSSGRSEKLRGELRNHRGGQSLLEQCEGGTAFIPEALHVRVLPRHRRWVRRSLLLANAVAS